MSITVYLAVSAADRPKAGSHLWEKVEILMNECIGRSSKISKQNRSVKTTRTPITEDSHDFFV